MVNKAVKVFTAFETTGAGYHDSIILNCKNFARAIVVVKELNIDAGHYRVFTSPSLLEDVWTQIEPANPIAQNTMEVTEHTDLGVRIKIQVKDDDGVAPLAKFDAWIILKRK